MLKPSAQPKISWRRSLPVLLASGGLLMASVPAISLAQSTPGFTWRWDGGSRDVKQLRYHLEYGTPGMAGDRYRFEFGVLNVAISQLRISYPNYYDGVFDPKAIEVRVGGMKSSGFMNLKRDMGQLVPLREVSLDDENHIIEIVPTEVIPAGQPVRVILSNVRNPMSGGMYDFKGWIMSPGDVPLSRGVGMWTISIFRS